jgi:hypothetical protein
LATRPNIRFHPFNGQRPLAIGYSLLALTLVSIPSRRVGDDGKIEIKAVSWRSFHPLKAGRRHHGSGAKFAEFAGFHPLKAGRRLPNLLPLRRFLLLFPSPQGGSETGGTGRRLSCTTQFPSPQGGSETMRRGVTGKRRMRFPSPQGGSETLRGRHFAFVREVSIPSRRVGDRGCFV